jgi:hypothetical protein
MTAIVVGGAAQHTVAAGEFKNLWDGVWRALISCLHGAATRDRLAGLRV